MFFLILQIFIFLFIVTIIRILNIKKKYFNLFLVYSVFYFFIAIVYFWVIKYGGVDLFTFKDEDTYLNTNYSLGYSYMVQWIANNFDIYWIRILQYSFFSFTIIFFFKVTIKNNILKYSIFEIILLSLAMFSVAYWSFFILKEVFVVSGLLLYLLSFKTGKLIYKFIGYYILIVTRPEFVFIIIFAELSYNILIKSKVIYFFIMSIALVTIKSILDLPLAVAIKTSIVARRFGESVKTFDPETMAAGKLDAISFVLSPEYLQVLKTNLVRTFSILEYSFSPVTYLLIFLNIFGFYYIVNNSFKLKQEKILYILMSLIVVLLMTHSVFRYFNAVIVPFIIYLYVIKNIGRKVKYV